MAARVEGFPRAWSTAFWRASRPKRGATRRSRYGSSWSHWAAAPPSKEQTCRHGPKSLSRIVGHQRERAWVKPALADCTALRARCYADPARRSALRTAASVPDDYTTWHRVAGLYWLTRIPFASGIRKWQEEVRESFAQPLSAVPVSGELKTYVPPPGRLSTAETAALLGRASANALGIPDPRGADLDAIFRSFAPAFVVDRRAMQKCPARSVWRGTPCRHRSRKSPVVTPASPRTLSGGRASAH